MKSLSSSSNCRIPSSLVLEFQSAPLLISLPSQSSGVVRLVPPSSGVLVGSGIGSLRGLVILTYYWGEKKGSGVGEGVVVGVWMGVSERVKGLIGKLLPPDAVLSVMHFQGRLLTHGLVVE